MSTVPSSWFQKDYPKHHLLIAVNVNFQAFWYKMKANIGRVASLDLHSQLHSQHDLRKRGHANGTRCTLLLCSVGTDPEAWVWWLESLKTEANEFTRQWLEASDCILHRYIYMLFILKFARSYLWVENEAQDVILPLNTQASDTGYLVHTEECRGMSTRPRPTDLWKLNPWLTWLAGEHTFSYVQDVNVCVLLGINIITVKFRLGYLGPILNFWRLFFIHFCFVLRWDMPHSAKSLEMDNPPASASWVVVSQTCVIMPGFTH